MRGMNERTKGKPTFTVLPGSLETMVMMGILAYEAGLGMPEKAADETRLPNVLLSQAVCGFGRVCSVSRL